MLYHLCTGEPPFPGPTIKAVLTGVREREPRPIRDLNPEIPPALEDHIRRLMAKDPADRFSSATELVRALTDVLAETQGRRRDPTVDDPHEDLQDPGPRPPGPGRGFEIVDEDVPAPGPKAITDEAIRTVSTSGPSIWRRALQVMGVATAVAVVAFATIWYIRSSWRNFGDDAPIILLLAFTGLAVFTWILVRLVNSLHGRGVEDAARRRWVAVLRNALATAILLPTAGTAYLEWSAYARSARALKAVNARHEKWIDSAPPTRQEVETLIGRTADDPPPGDVGSQIMVTYRWRGVFRTFALRAKYLRLRYNMRNPRAKPAEGEEGFDTLYWISDVLE